MTSLEDKQFIESLDNMTQTQLVNLDSEALCLHIRQLIHIIRNIDLISVRPVGPQTVLRVESSLPPASVIMTDEKKKVGRAYD